MAMKDVIGAEEEKTDVIAFHEACLFDSNGVDGITVEELETVIRSLGQNPTAEDIRDLLCEAADVADGGASLEFAEFLNLIAAKSKEKDTEEEELKEAFKVFDKDQNGFISPSALRQVMINLGEKLTDEEVEQMINEADSDGDGLVNFDDFVKFMTSF
ncbi:hypothetical protein V2J09_022961 [Rumex salicifolius]